VDALTFTPSVVGAPEPPMALVLGSLLGLASLWKMLA
jgi:hypothetical protein